MTKEYLEILHSSFKEAVEYNSEEKNKIKVFKNNVDTINTYNQFLKQIEPEVLESFDLEEEDHEIIEYYKSISRMND